MAITGKVKKNRHSTAGVRQPARRIELKNSGKRGAGNKKLRRTPEVQKNNSGFLAAIWRKLRVPFRWGFGMGLGLLLFFLAGVGLLYAYSFLTTNPYFAVKTIEIQGQNRLKSREVLEIAGLDYGQNILALSINDLESALARNFWIAEISVRRVLPDGIRIKIREYEPHYWVHRSGQLVYADEYGASIAPVSADNFSSYPLLEVEGGAEHFASRLPELMASLEGLGFPLNVRTAGSIRLTASRSLEVSLEGGLRLGIGLDDWAGNVSNLVRVLEDLSRRGELKNAVEIKSHGENVWAALKRGQA